MTREQAIEFLESRDYCMKHYVPAERDARKKLVCPKCVEADREIEQGLINQAIRILQGSNPTSPSFRQWVNCESRLPKANERAEFILLGFREAGKSGGKDRYTFNSKPTFWRPLE